MNEAWFHFGCCGWEHPPGTNFWEARVSYLITRKASDKRLFWWLLFSTLYKQQPWPVWRGMHRCTEEALLMEQIRPTKEKKKTKKKQQPKRMPALCPRDANNSMVRHKQVHWRVTRQRKHLKGRLKATFLSQLPLYGVEIHRWFNCFTWLSFISLFHIRELCVCVLVLIDSQRVRLRFRKLIYLFTPPPPNC